MVGPTDYSALFLLYDPLANRPLRLTTEGDSDWLSGEQAVALSRGELSLQRPLRLSAYMGGQVADFLWSGLASLVVISRRVVELFQDHAFTGWATYPVSDVFLVRGFKVVTLPVQKAFRRAKVGNVRFTPLAEVELNTFLYSLDAESERG